MESALALVGDELKQVEEQFRIDLDSEVPLIRKVGEYVLASGGKRIRPLLLLMAAKVSGYQGDRHIPLASVVEFIHTATLLHDDVVDSSDIRRGAASANAVWGNEASVLIGDYLFSKSFSLMVAQGDLAVLKVLAGATTTIAEGEVLQLVSTADATITEERYLSIIQGKTAVLLSAACEVGAILGKVSPVQQQALRDYGMDLGVAFQLMDDTLDYTATQEEFGKPTGHDILEGKVTLPLIHTLRTCSSEDQERITAILCLESPDSAAIAEISSQVRIHGGIEQTMQRAAQYVSSAKARLDVFPDTPPRRALYDIADYVVSRSK
ncbi:MAG TPA: polyprenyl synthetase family protein [Geobacterales bacterium]|nr:polyprenyl synthetase family protein [Geobacterales bacterium]